MQPHATNLTPVRRPAPDTLLMERILPGPIERVWAYLVEADKRAQWFSGGTTMTAAGQSATLFFRHKDFADEPTPERWKEMDKEGFRSEVTVLAFDKPNRLAYTWPQGDETSEVTFELAPEGNDVKLTLTHRRVVSTSSQVSFASGWHSHFYALDAVLRGGKPKGFWTTVLKLNDEYGKAFGL